MVCSASSSYCVSANKSPIKRGVRTAAWAPAAVRMVRYMSEHNLYESQASVDTSRSPMHSLP